DNANPLLLWILSSAHQVEGLALGVASASLAGCLAGRRVQALPALAEGKARTGGQWLTKYFTFTIACWVTYRALGSTGPCHAVHPSRSMPMAFALVARTSHRPVAQYWL